MAKRSKTTFPKEIDALFEHFGKIAHAREWPLGTPNETIAWDMAEQWDRDIEPGHGMFFDFVHTPELQEPVLGLLTNAFGWTLERPFFIRKPGGEQEQD